MKVYLKFIMVLTCFFCAYLTQAQKTSIKSRIITYDEATVSQSSTIRGQESEFGFDQNLSTISQTEVGDNQYFKIDFENRILIAGIEFHNEISEEFYLVSSKVPINLFNISELIADPWNNYIHFPNGTPNIDVVPIASFISENLIIIIPGEGSITLNDVTVYGINPLDFDETANGILPDDSDCEKCPLVTDLEYYNPNFPPPTEEFCSNGIDDDSNGLTDCEDPDCGVGTVSFEVTIASCETCSDGVICIYASRADEVSLDGGVTWSVMSGENPFCISGLEVDKYDVVLRRGSCESELETINITFLVPADGDCQNAGFEEGDFSGWSAERLVYTSDMGWTGAGVTFNPNFYEIVNSNSFTDFQAPPLEELPPGVNGNFARIGRRLGSNNFNFWAKATKCIMITEDNANLTFAYSAVLDPPGSDSQDHDDDQLPYVAWKVYMADTGDIIEESIEKDHISSSSSTVSSGFEDFLYLPWDCQSFDLSSYIGQEICVEFAGIGCEWNDHPGYMYVDMQCDVGGIGPVVLESEVVELGCDGNLININVDANFYTTYEWKIHTLRNGNKVDEISLGVKNDQFEKSIYNVFQTYRKKLDRGLDCMEKVIVELHLLNSCAAEVVSFELEPSCIGWKAAFPNSFSPLDDNNVNEEFFFHFNTNLLFPGLDADCSVMNDLDEIDFNNTSIKYARLQIFDFWGNLIFDGEAENTSFDLKGDESSLRWDGTFNGLDVVPEVYAYQMFVESCGSNFACNDCGPSSVYNYCSTGKIVDFKDQSNNKRWGEIIVGTVTVVP